MARGQIGANWIAKGEDTHAKAMDLLIAFEEMRVVRLPITKLRKKGRA